LPFDGPLPRTLSRTVRLLDVDPELGQDLGEEAAAQALRRAVLRLAMLPAGPLDPDLAGSRLLVLDGAVLRETVLGAHVAAELLGPGDVVGGSGTGDSVVAGVARWTVHTPGSAAVLDERMAAVARHWPQVGLRLQDRVAAQGARTATLAAITQLPRVELRVAALLWHLAERWGRVTPDGVVLPLRLTHRTLGQLIGARRPTVTLAVGQLVADGTIDDPASGRWLLLRGPADDGFWARQPAAPRRAAVPAEPA
jgi:CRP-like cAMP-binding protein